MSEAPLWQRALEHRHREKLDEAAKPTRHTGRAGGRRTHPPLAVNQKLGCWTVVSIIGRGHANRSDLRVALRCTCGRWLETYEFNARKRAQQTECQHPAAKQRNRAKARAQRVA